MRSTTFKEIVRFIRELYETDEFIPLHEPRFFGREKELVQECIDSTFVSSVGKYVDRFEREIERFTGAKHAVAVVNGTQALYMALLLVGAEQETEVITQSLTFVATANAIHYTRAKPVFVDVDLDTMGLSPQALSSFLHTNTEGKNGKCWNRSSGKQIIACVPMHTFGHPCRIKEIGEICDEFDIALVEDAAESLGSYENGIHTGRIGKLGILSFNGNKIITTGGGGMIITDDDHLAKRAKHLTTTSKVEHPWEFNHDEIGYNFRMPNLNAAFGVAQLEQLPDFLSNKRKLAEQYHDFCEGRDIEFIEELKGFQTNHWLNAVLLEDRNQRDAFLEYTNRHNVMTRGFWTPMHLLPMFNHCQSDMLENTQNLFGRVVNLPSSVRD
jgi:perosamine synthetase